VIAGAGLDTLHQEPPAADNPLLTADNCVITPHVAWATLDARARITGTVAENISAYLAGKPQNVINA
jgi:glycerate dehydrogenase